MVSEDLVTNYSLSIGGAASIKIFSREFIYKGEVDTDGKACGRGIAYLSENHRITYEGTFFDNGICKSNNIYKN